MISQSLCLARFGCSQCAEACPAKAITATNGSISIDPDKCTLCGVCFAKCPERAFGVGRDGDAVKLYLNTAKCAGCGYCAAVCPEKAIAVSKAHALLPEVEEKAVDHVVRCKSCGGHSTRSSTCKPSRQSSA